MSPSQSPPSSSVGRGPPSSPFAGTDPTLYTPEVVRKAGRTTLPTVAESSKAAGKKPVEVLTVLTIGHTTYRGLHPQPHAPGVFANELETTDPSFVSRHITIQVIPDGSNPFIMAGTDHELELAKVQERMKQYQVFNSCVPIYNRGVHLRFDDLQDAAEAKAVLEQHDFACSFVDNYEFALAKSQDTAAIDEHEGQVRIVVRIMPTDHGTRPSFGPKDLMNLHKDVEVTMTIFGSLKCLVHVATNTDTLEFTFRMEYFSVEAANRAVASLTKTELTRLDDTGMWHLTFHNVMNWSGPRPANSPHRRLPRVDDKGRFTEYRHLPQVNANALPNVARDPRPNQVQRDQILNGTDVRTTVMLRNIPNKLDWMTLKALLDQVCFATYDFLYLRIDFKSGHNVGYAFINFSDINGMISMLDQVEHRGWTGYRSSKNAELSYATIQGREALVQKFRNSSVMQQTPYCRPRLFRTFDEVASIGKLRLAGQEVPFPNPDNWSKYQRSIDSAKTVGLFPPTGMTHQTVDRTHLSAYDRGTPRDMVHTANMFNYYGHPPRFNGFLDHEKRLIERLFGDRFGPAQSGFVAFENIPTRLAHELFDEYAQAHGLNIVRNPGVIGRPSNVNVAPLPMYANNGPIYGQGLMTGYPNHAGPAFDPASYYQNDPAHDVDSGIGE
ncbi:hypothetical protein N0V90_001647 [Kalmusia sp. IMI 367209]|nr:hypothetical protein N0V90_001647 [Kalmusia sp. IMI 367209]